VTAYKLIALKVTGTARYTDKEILAASGLQMGQNAADGDFKEAVQRLGDSGVFSNVVYSYSSSNAGTRLEFQLADTDKSKLVPARFENFVWFTDDELRTELQNRVPLFKQVLPIAGNLPDRVSEALQAMLTEKQLPGRVDFFAFGRRVERRPQRDCLPVEEVSIRIRGVEFPGASPEQTALLTTAAAASRARNTDALLLPQPLSLTCCLCTAARIFEGRVRAVRRARGPAARSCCRCARSRRT